MKEEPALGAVLAALRRRWLLVAVASLVIVAVVLGAVQARPSSYEATAILLTGQDSGIGDVGSILELNQATQSLSSLITERVVVRDAAQSIRYDGDVEVLLDQVSVNVPPNTQVIELTVADRDAEQAARLANAIAETFSDLVREKASDASNLTAVVWQEAEPPRDPVGPRRAFVGAVALFFGLLVGAGLALIREHLDRRWRSEQDVERWTGFPVLGMIPDVDQRRSRRQAYR